MAKKSTVPVKYENNPFFAAANSITLLVDLARGVLLFLAVLAAINFFFGIVTPDYSKPSERDRSMNRITDMTTSWTANDWIIAALAVAVITLALLMISALLGGVAAYTSARVARGKSVRLDEAFRVAFDKLWSFLWLQLVIAGKLLLWTLLFILPGIYMAFRYSLANVAFFDKDLRGNNAIKESLRLTKGAWLTTFASNMLFNTLTFGMISNVVNTGVNAVLYRQYEALGNKPKPSAHWLSWVTLVVPVFFVFFAFFALIAIVVGLAIGVSITR